MRKSDLEPYPLLQAYDIDPPPMSRGELASASFDERFATASRSCVSIVMSLFRSLSPEGRASLGPEDIFLECWMELKRRDRFYRADRGEYAAFAAVVFRNRFRELVLASRVVKLPMRIRVKMRDEDEEAERHRMRWSDHAEVPRRVPDLNQKEPLDAIVSREDHVREEKALLRWVQKLKPGEIVGAVALGLGDVVPRTPINQLAKEYRCKRTDILAAMESAMERMEDVKIVGE